MTPDCAPSWPCWARSRAGGPVRERWFWPGSLCRRLRRDFVAVRAEYLLSPNERRRFVFRVVPAARLMTIWSARVPEIGSVLQLSARRVAGAKLLPAPQG